MGKREKDSILMSASLLGCECPQLVVRAASRMEMHGDSRAQHLWLQVERQHDRQL